MELAKTVTTRTDRRTMTPREAANAKPSLEPRFVTSLSAFVSLVGTKALVQLDLHDSLGLPKMQGVCPGTTECGQPTRGVLFRRLAAISARSDGGGKRQTFPPP